MFEWSSIEAFMQSMIDTGIRNQLRIEYSPKADSAGFGMTGSGMLVINPPYTLAADMKAVLQDIAPVLADGIPQWQITELVGE